MCSATSDACMYVHPGTKPFKRITPKINMAGSRDGSKSRENLFQFKKEINYVACGILAAWAVTAASPVIAAAQRLPPLSTEPNRCEKAFVGNTIGQANGVYDKPIDLRFCDYTNDKSNLKGKSLAAALMSDAKFDGADMTEVVMSKAYAVGASFRGNFSIQSSAILSRSSTREFVHGNDEAACKWSLSGSANDMGGLKAIENDKFLFLTNAGVDFSNAVLDRVNFGKADLKGAVFKNTVLSGSTFDEAQLEDAIFEDTIIGYIDLQKICRNTSIGPDGRAELGCR
ncbi:hypothetical protein POTOM_042685 [Populus tomentosa]|uniref:Thylakoid lumenal 17.4 kDa protein, chloroplastic n=1 Tax=Populus tomentosa TaxID=118781 RepID=A0A8X8CF21_POPTO|nr:hypothetical protein POTOM_042685 [Populus tomentosa]